MSERTPKHVTQLSKIFSDLKEEIIMYGFDTEENTDKQLPMNLFLNKFDQIVERLNVLEGNMASTTVNLTQFYLSQASGFNTQSHALEFKAVINDAIWASDITTMTISYGDTVVSLLGTNALKAGVTLADGNLTVNLSDFSKVWDISTTFTLDIELTNGDSAYLSTTYYAFTPISVAVLGVTNAETDNNLELISLSLTLDEFELDLDHNLIEATVDFSNLIESINYTFNDIELTDSFSISPLSSEITCTAVVTQTTDFDSVTVYTSVITLTPIYSIIVLNDLLASKTSIFSNTNTSIMFTSHASRSLQNATSIYLFDINNIGEGDEIHDFGNISGSTISGTVVINIADSTTYKIRVIEPSIVNPEEDWISWSPARLITAGVVLDDPIYWGYIEGFTNDLYAEHEVDLRNEIINSGIVSEDNLFIDPSPVPSDLTLRYGTIFGSNIIAKRWVAVPTSKYASEFNNYYIVGFPDDNTSVFSTNYYHYHLNLDINGVSTPYILYFKVIDASLSDMVFETI